MKFGRGPLQRVERHGHGCPVGGNERGLGRAQTRPFLICLENFLTPLNTSVMGGGDSAAAAAKGHMRLAINFTVDTKLEKFTQRGRRVVGIWGKQNQGTYLQTSFNIKDQPSYLCWAPGPCGFDRDGP